MLALGIAIYAEMNAPRPVDWSESYSRHRKIPYGAYVLYELFAEERSEESRRTGGTIETTTRPIYNTLDERYDAEGAAYVVINSDFHPDELDREAILEFVESGHTLFVAAGELDDDFADSLGVEVGRGGFGSGDLEDFLLRDTVAMNLETPTLRASEPWPLRVGRGGMRWLERFDTARSVVLGRDTDGRANFVRIERGDGSIYLHTVPAAFANFNVLVDRNAEYAFAALSHVAESEIIWDEYYKADRSDAGSPLGALLRDEALNWAWVVTLVGVVLFVFVFGRRRQRAIPVIPPPANTTLEFATTVGRLYFEHGDHRGIAAKKVAYFQEYLRSHLDLRVGDAEPELARRVAERSGIAEERVRTIFSRIQHLHRASEFGEEDLKALNADLEDFYSNSKR